MGETDADMFSMTLNLGYGETIIIFMSLFLVLLEVKLYMKKYNLLAYWSVFTATAIAGTGVSDFIDRTLGLGYAAGSLILVLLLLAILALWYNKEKRFQWKTSPPAWRKFITGWRFLLQIHSALLPEIFCQTV